VISVKAGKLHATYVRDLEGVRNREKAEIGVLVSFDEPTKPMRKEAASAGFYISLGEASPASASHGRRTTRREADRLPTQCWSKPHLQAGTESAAGFRIAS